MPKMISPNELHQGAQDEMLEGKAPVTERDWQLCVNFWAANVSISEIEICKLMKRLFQCPLDDKQIVEIAKFQQGKKKGQ
jgi:hypothetical protein